MSIAEKLTTIAENMQKVYDAGKRIAETKPYINTSKLTDFAYFCYRNHRLGILSKLDTSNGTNFDSMFSECTSLTSIPSFNTSKGQNFSCMFYKCTSLTAVPPLDMNKAINVISMFAGCSKLQTIGPLDTHQVKNFHRMFDGCTSLTSIELLNTNNGTSFGDTFRGCINLKDIDIVGAISANFNIGDSVCLSKSSIINIFNHLSTAATNQTLTLNKSAVNDSFETSKGLSNGIISDEWATLIATKPNWTISLV